MRLTIPCKAPGGLDSEISEHFGDCDVFTVIDIDLSPHQFKILKVQVIKNRAHLNCGSLVLRLKKLGTDVAIVNRISPRILELLEHEQISTYVGKGIVQQVVKDFCKNRLGRLTPENICYGIQYNY
ncbi:MAG: NifB/NifX family molybdenum-iron cluster-binding protein [Candidatus Helarchaeota archaeon]